MSPLDHFVKRALRCAGYLRYVDDFLLFADDKKALCDRRDGLVTRLARLRLTMHRGALPRPVSEAIPFLGFTVFPDRRHLKRRKALHFRRRLRSLISSYKTGVLPLSGITQAVRAWANHTSYGNTVGLRKAILRRVLVTGG